MSRISYIDEDGKTVDLTSEEAERRLERDRELRREYAKWTAMFRGKGGRMIVVDGEPVRRALADAPGPQEQRRTAAASH